MKKIFLSPFFTPIAFTALWVTLITVVLCFFPEQKFLITQEGQILEIFTNIGYVLMLAAIIYLAVKYTKFLISSFFKLNTVTWSTAVLCTVLVCAKFADRFPSNWKKAHDNVPLPVNQFETWALLEESSEMFLPYLVIVIMWQYHLLCKKAA